MTESIDRMNQLRMAGQFQVAVLVVSARSEPGVETPG